MSLAVSADARSPHDTYRRSQAIPAIGVQQFNGGSTHHIEARVDQYQRRRTCGLCITSSCSNSEHLYRCLQGLELRGVPERMIAPGFQAGSNRTVNLLS